MESTASAGTAGARGGLRNAAIYVVDMLRTVLRPSSGQWNELDFSCPIMDNQVLRDFFVGMSNKKVRVIAWIDLSLIISQTEGDASDTSPGHILDQKNSIFWQMNGYCDSIAIYEISMAALKSIVTAETVLVSAKKNWSIDSKIITAQEFFGDALINHYRSIHKIMAAKDVVFIIPNNYCTKLGIHDRNQAIYGTLCKNSWVSDSRMVECEYRHCYAKRATSLGLSYIFLRVLDGGGLTHGDGTPFVPNSDEIESILII